MAQRTLHGSPGAPGIGQGRAVFYADRNRPPAPAGETAALPAAARAPELARFRQACARVAADLRQVAAEVRTRLDPAVAEVFAAQALFLRDPALIDPIEAAIQAEGMPAARAVARSFAAGAEVLAALDDPVLRARAADLQDVGRRLMMVLQPASGIERATLPPSSILIARDLAPSDTLGLAANRVAGIVLAEGTPTAHAAILARGLGLPLVLAAGDAVWQIAPGAPVLVDGTTGLVLVEPTAEEQDMYHQQAGAQGAPATETHGPALTRDGHRVRLLANASSALEAQQALAYGAEGLGLVRTEFLLPMPTGDPSAPPDEDALAAAYAAILGVMGPHPVTVRALDAGGDKPLPFLDFGHEANPFLGWRGIRVLLDQPDLFMRQTRALLRGAAHHGTDLRLMFPMISSLEEFRAARRLVEQVQARAGITLSHPLQIGVMLEVPAAILIADALAQEADFFSLGTNDLVQYTLACDRGNPRTARLYQFLHPAVLRLVQMAVHAAGAAGRSLSVCGEAASDPAALPVLVGLGIDALSVSPAFLPAVRRQLGDLSFIHLQEVAARAARLATAEAVRALLRQEGFSAAEPSAGSTGRE
jgi:phosphoenolpyruvate-protein phosphotransferase